MSIKLINFKHIVILMRIWEEEINPGIKFWIFVEISYGSVLFIFKEYKKGIYFEIKLLRRSFLHLGSKISTSLWPYVHSVFLRVFNFLYILFLLAYNPNFKPIGI